MIDAKELRIGNKLQKSNEEIFTISKLDQTQDVLVKEERGLLTLGYNLIGIPLTEELLLKNGFTDLKDNSWGEFIDMWIDKINFVNVLMKDELFIGKDSKTNLYYFLVTRTGNGEYMYFESISAPMQYLHTLQNYYVTFKGEELEINL